MIMQMGGQETQRLGAIEDRSEDYAKQNCIHATLCKVMHFNAKIYAKSCSLAETPDWPGPNQPPVGPK